VEKLFLKALKQEPRNAEILGAYADFLVNRAGREEEASKLFQRAVEADGDNRDNLEAYAQFLRFAVAFRVLECRQFQRSQRPMLLALTMMSRQVHFLRGN
jgi:tetratricopeptide (TPR) repeat protein